MNRQGFFEDSSRWFIEIFSEYTGLLAAILLAQFARPELTDSEKDFVTIAFVVTISILVGTNIF